MYDQARWLGLVCLTVVLSELATAGEVLDRSLAQRKSGEATLWYSIQHLDLEGRGWSDTKAPFDRLPAKAEEIVRAPVWRLSQQSAGICARFVTDATQIKTRWSLTSSNLAMPHMPATGVSGLDLYVKLENGRWRWLAVGQPRQGQTNSITLIDGLPEGKREFMLYLPLYNGVSSVEIGIAPAATLAKAERRGPGLRKPIVFDGTSITQGGCASRPGMVHTAILGRWLNYPVINLGFSGNGRMEPEMAQLFAELDPSVYVLDCLPNMQAAEVSDRVEPFVRTLRQAHADTPILLVEDRSYTNSFLVLSRHKRNQTSRAALRTAFKNLQAAGIANLHYLAGDQLLGEDGEDTVDSSHPTDLGFLRQAEAFQKVLKPLLGNGQ